MDYCAWINKSEFQTVKTCQSEATYYNTYGFVRSFRWCRLAARLEDVCLRWSCHGLQGRFGDVLFCILSKRDSYSPQPLATTRNTLSPKEVLRLYYLLFGTSEDSLKYFCFWEWFQRVPLDSVFFSFHCYSCSSVRYAMGLHLHCTSLLDCQSEPTLY